MRYDSIVQDCTILVCFAMSPLGHISARTRTELSVNMLVAVIASRAKERQIRREC